MVIEYYALVVYSRTNCIYNLCTSYLAYKKFDLDECTNQFNINMLNIFKYCQSKKFSLLDAFIFIRSYAKQKHDNMYCKKI